MKKWESEGDSAAKIGQQFWFAVQVREHFERVIETALTGKNIEAFVPLSVRRRPWSDRVKKIEAPLFGGYVFCRIDPEHRLQVLTIPGVHYFVGIGKVPTPILDGEIESVRTLVQSGAAAEARPFIADGQRVRIEEGPLQGAEGILVRTEGADSLVVSITLLQRSVAVMLDRNWIGTLDVLGETSLPRGPVYRLPAGRSDRARLQNSNRG